MNPSPSRWRRYERCRIVTAYPLSLHVCRLMQHKFFNTQGLKAWQLAEEHGLALERQAEKHHRLEEKKERELRKLPSQADQPTPSNVPSNATQDTTHVASSSIAGCLEYIAFASVVCGTRVATTAARHATRPKLMAANQMEEQVKRYLEASKLCNRSPSACISCMATGSRYQGTVHDPLSARDSAGRNLTLTQVSEPA